MLLSYLVEHETADFNESKNLLKAAVRPPDLLLEGSTPTDGSHLSASSKNLLFRGYVVLLNYPCPALSFGNDELAKLSWRTTD